MYKEKDANRSDSRPMANSSLDRTSFFIFCLIMSSGAQKKSFNCILNCVTLDSFSISASCQMHGDVTLHSGVRHQNDSLLMIYHHDQVIAIGKCKKSIALIKCVSNFEWQWVYRLKVGAIYFVHLKYITESNWLRENFEEFCETKFSKKMPKYNTAQH